MNVFTKTVMCVALTAAASSASAAVISYNVAYDGNAAAAETAFLGNTYNQLTEDFDLFDDSKRVVVTNKPHASWVDTAPYFDTKVGLFTNVSPETGQGDDVSRENLMIEDKGTGEFGRDTTGQWLDSNDADQVRWDLKDGKFNALGFFLSDANDQGAQLELIFNDTVSTIIDLDFDLPNGNLMYISIYSDLFFNSANLIFNNGVGNNDGWGIDNVTIARVPEPATLALLGLGLAGMTTFRRRK